MHSGTFGGAVHNPLQALCTILARLHDADGRVAVPFHDPRARPLTEQDRAALAQIPFTRAAWLAEAGNPPDDWGEPEYTISERTSSGPTLEINGLAGGFAGDGLKTVLPSCAIANISCRLVADQDTGGDSQPAQRDHPRVRDPRCVSRSNRSSLAQGPRSTSIIRPSG